MLQIIRNVSAILDFKNLRLFFLLLINNYNLLCYEIVQLFLAYKPLKGGGVYLIKNKFLILLVKFFHLVAVFRLDPPISCNSDK